MRKTLEEHSRTRVITVSCLVALRDSVTGIHFRFSLFEKSIRSWYLDNADVYFVRDWWDCVEDQKATSSHSQGAAPFLITISFKFGSQRNDIAYATEIINSLIACEEQWSSQVDGKVGRVKLQMSSDHSNLLISDVQAMVRLTAVARWGSTLAHRLVVCAFKE